MSASLPAPRQRTFLGHPVGLYVLFFTEMWERFSYYGMRALLILYMVNYFKWDQKEAGTVYKVYTSFVYVTPILGGFLADRYLGNRLAVIIGASLMAVGHFLMAFEEYPIFLSALGFLILGNGMFKPNMSTQVGRLYPKNDGRLDAAYTIFYMGVNLGAFLAPIACGWLADNTVGGYHTGFTMAGIGMVLGLIIYLAGQPAVREIAEPPGFSASPAPGAAPLMLPATGPGSQSVTPAAPQAVTDRPLSEDISHELAPGMATPGPRPLTEAEAEATPSALGPLSAAVEVGLYVLAAGMLVAAPVLWRLKTLDVWDALMLAIAGVCAGLVGLVAGRVRGGVRDRVVSILVIGVFVMFFWGAYEQAGNVLNLWADKNTDRYMTQEPEPPPLYPEVEEDKPGEEAAAGRKGVFERFVTMWHLKTDPNKPQQTWGQWFRKSFNPVPTAWYQSINALAIFVIAPVFAWMWIWLDRKGLQPSISMKMFLGLVLMSLSVAVMIAAADQENQYCSVSFDRTKVPAGLSVADDGALGDTDDDGEKRLFQAGRLKLIDDELELQGVLADNERDRILGATAPAAYRARLKQMQESAKDLTKGQRVVIELAEVPPGFDMRFAGLKKSEVVYDAESRTLTTFVPLKEKEMKGLLAAAGDPAFRDTINKLYVESHAFRVSSWWLLWSYVLATLGELCISPVGLSMVSKLAPARFATMLMGIWLLTSAFGNFAAGLAGEQWGTVAPVPFFLYTTLAVAAAAAVLLVLVRLLTRMMHGVN